MSKVDFNRAVLLSNALVSGTEKSDPVIVVGLPRSGSSYLSDVLSQLNGCYVFDDLYLYRKARSIKALGKLNNNKLKELILFLGWQVRARIKFGDFSVPHMNLADVDEMDVALYESFVDKHPMWFDLQKEWLIRLSKSQGASTWGYKSPGDFMNIDMLKKIYPEARFIFLIRNPSSIMMSYKNLTKDAQDGNPGQYHPIAYALYWKMAVDSYVSYSKKISSDIFLIKYEDLVKNPENTAIHLSNFLGVDFSGGLLARSANTSFVSEKKKELTGLESYLCDKITHRQMEIMGYQTKDYEIKGTDFIDLILTSVRFTAYQIRRVIKNESGGLSTLSRFVNRVFK